MASEGRRGLVPPTQRGGLDTGFSSQQLVFQDESTTSLRFPCGPPQRQVGGDPGPKTTTLELTGFIDDHRFFQPQAPDFRRSIFGGADRLNWNGNGRNSAAHSGDGSDDDEDEDDEDDDEDEVDDGDGEVDGLAMDDSSNKNHNSNSSNASGHSSAAADRKAKHLSSFGSSREVMMKENNLELSGSENNDMRASEDHQQGRVSQHQTAVTIADPNGDLYYSQYLQGMPDGSGAGQKDKLVENGCGFSGRKDVSYANESRESLTVILSDPVTGALMDDAMILRCGHSFGGGGMQHVIRNKACCTCSQPVSEDSVAPNLSLRATVQAFRREEELQVHRASKRRRDRFEQDKNNYGDLTLMDHPRGRGVQFPFVVTDRVIIKGNKRTPQRFVGREAVVTTQCLNGWYVVKTLDNAESVKLQYRSLAKVPDNPTSKQLSVDQTGSRVADLKWP